MNKKRLQGFTLIEILIVIGLIAVLATTTVVAMNPGRDFQEARNSQRTSEIRQILSAISQDVVDGKTLTSYLDGSGNPLTKANSPCGSLTVLDGWAIHMNNKASPGLDEIDLSPYITPKYIGSIPEDPHDGAPDSGDTGYRLCSEATTRITIFAPLTEGGGVLNVSI